MKTQRAIFIFLCALFLASPAAAFIYGGSQGVVNPPYQLSFPTTNLVGLYSVAKQIGYSDNCITVKRASDSTTQDIAFNSIGFCDFASAFTFGTSTTLTVTKIYDQSGNNNDLTCSSNCPALTAANTILGMQGITFYGNRMAIPTTLTTSRQAETVFSVFAPMAENPSASVWELNNVWTNGLVLQKTGAGDVLLDGTAFRVTGIYSRSQPEVSVVTSSASSKTYQADEVLTTGITASLSGTTSGGSVGLPVDLSGYQIYGEFYALAIYQAVMSQPNIQAQKNSLYGTFNVLTTGTARVIFDGDSITFGTGSTLGINNPRQAEPLFTYRVYLQNVGIFGQLFSTCLSNETSRIINSYKGGLAKNILVIAAGTNDITAGITGANLFNNDLVPYVSAAKTKGYSVIVGTLIYNSAQTAGENTQRIAYNTLVKSNAVANGYSVVDYDSISQLQNPQTVGYSADGTHPTTLGYGLMAALVATQVNALLP